jgi:two-component system, LuxR family, sensor kinase FixL
MAAPSDPQRTTLRSKVLLGFGVVLLMLVLIAAISVQSTRGFDRTSQWVAITYEAIEVQERMLRNVAEVDASRRRYLQTGEESALLAFQTAQSSLSQAINSLRMLTANTPGEAARIDRLEELLSKTLALQQAQIDARKWEDPQPDTSGQEEEEIARSIADVRAVLTEAQMAERDVLSDRADLTERIGRSNIAAVLAGSILTIVALIIACLLILRDLKARHRAEEALAQEHNLLSSIINAMPNQVYVKDAKGRFILDNSAHRSYLGLSEAQSVEGKTVFDYFAPAIAAKFDHDEREVMETGAAMLSAQEPAIPLAEEGRETWLESNKVPLRDTDGKIVGLVGISSDISARREDEEKLKRFAEQLERSNAELQNFASVASHDLQEPLRKIQAFGDRLKAKCATGLGEQGRDYLERMQNAAGRMQTLIQDLLKLSRVTSRGQPFEKCDLGEIVRQVLSDLEIAIEQKAAKIELGALPTIDADPLQMRQLFQNLIANAMKFHRPGEQPEVIISGRVFEMRERLISGAAPGDKICQLHVEDNGIGFDEKFAEQIFVVFQRLHTREEYEGTGIGLAVCRKITDRHGGSIVAKSAPGQGASFIITLPVNQPIPPSS